MRLGVCGPGLGALHVSSALARTVANLSIVHLADVTNNPYGSRRPTEIRELVKGTLRAMKQLGCEVVAVGCNTSSTQIDSAMRALPQGDRPQKVLGLISSTVDGLARDPNQGGLLVLGTEATILGNAFPNSIRRRGLSFPVQQLAIPGVVELVDRSRPLDELRPIVDAAIGGGRINWNSVERVGLFCTHFPIVQNLFEEAITRVAGRSVQVVTQAQFLRNELAMLPALTELNPSTHLFLTEPSQVLASAARHLFPGVKLETLDPRLVPSPRAVALQP